MKLRIFENYQEMSEAAAGVIMEVLQRKPDSLVCFATGDTPKLTYQILVENEQKLDFSRCFFIGLDEWLGIPPENSGSCHYFLYKYLFGPLSIKPSQIHLFNALASDEDEECKKMNSLIEKKGPIDLMIVGVGMNGHIGFNEPGADFGSKAHVSILDDTTRTVGKKYFEAEVPITKGITLGLKQVMETSTLLMIANGSKKAPVIKKALENDINNSFPATVIRLHKNSLLFIDQVAAAELKTRYE